MKRFISLFICLFVLISTVKCETVHAAQPTVSASSAIVIEAESGRVIYSHNASEVRSMASTTKIMTALLAIESEQMDEIVTITAQMLQTEGSSMYLKEGEKLTLRALVCGLLLESGNDAANAIAIAVSGSLERFADAMNKRAKELGMYQTNFVTPSGLDDDEHETTAHDMALLGAVAIRNQEFREIASKSSMSVSWEYPQKTRTLYYHNRLLNEMEGCIGIKTGYTKKSGRCLVTACERDGITLIAVTLNAPNDWQDHKKLMEYAYSQVELITLKPHGLEISLPVVGGGADRVMVNDNGSASAVIPKGRSGDVRMRVETKPFLYAPLLSGDYAGRVIYELDGESIGEIPLTVARNVEFLRREYGFWERIWRFLKKLFGFG